MFVFHRIDDVYAQRHDLMRILALFERLDIPAILGVIPARLTAEMAAYLAVRPLFTVFQHGVAHKNYAATGRKDEFPDTRPVDDVARLVADGRRRLEDGIGRLVTGYIPPWNTASASLLSALATLDFTHISAGRSAVVLGALKTLPIALDSLDSYAPPTAKPATATIAELEVALPNRSPVGIVYHIKDLSKADMVEIESVIRWSARHAPMPRPWSQFVGAA